MKELSLQRVQEEIQAAMDVLSLTPDTLHLITLFPLLQVAWASDDLAPKQLQAILEVAEEHGLAKGKTGKILATWLEKKPEPQFWHCGLYLMSVLLGPISEEEKGDLIELSERVGKAAGGLFDVVFTLSSSEKAALAKIGASLGIADKRARKEAVLATQNQFGQQETTWQHPTQWHWVQLGSLIIVGLLGGIIFLQQFFVGIFMPGASANLFATSELPLKISLPFFVVLPLVAFFIGGMFIGWKSEGEINREAILATLIPIFFYWVFWTAFLVFFKHSALWDLKRLVFLLTFTALASITAAFGARLADALTSEHTAP